MAWTVALFRKERATFEVIKTQTGVTGKELWIEGAVDPAARKALETMGWKVEAKVRDKLAGK